MSKTCYHCKAMYDSAADRCPVCFSLSQHINMYMELREELKDLKDEIEKLRKHKAKTDIRRATNE